MSRKCMPRRFVKEGAFIYPYMTISCRIWPWSWCSSDFLPQHQLIHSCIPRRCKSGSQWQCTVGFATKRGNTFYLVRIMREFEINQNIFPVCPSHRPVFPFFIQLSLTAHVMQPIGLAKKLKGLLIPDSSSVKAKGHSSTEVLKAKTHLTLFKLWLDMCAKHRKQLSNNNLQ